LRDVQAPSDERRPHRGRHTRGYLPHIDDPRNVQLLTFRQNDSAPAKLIRAYRQVLGEAKTPEAVESAESRVFVHFEKYLARGRGSCRLRDPRAARVVEDSLLFGDRQHYDLLSWVVMPNHVHVVVRQKLGIPLDRVIWRWKSWMAHEINRIFRTSGRFWQPEVFDHWLRDGVRIEGAVRYVELNPVVAGLCENPLDWEFSSARRHPERWTEVATSSEGPG
jgi:REP element-mobilizing transposase RayT